MKENAETEDDRPGSIAFFRRIDVRLPLSIAFLLAGVVSLVTCLAYVEIRDEAAMAASMRLEEVSRRLADLTTRSTTGTLEATGKFAARQEILDAFAASAEDTEGTARSFLEPIVKGNAQNLAIELWNADLTPRLLVSNTDVPGASEVGGVVPTWAGAENPTLGPLRPFGKEVLLSISAPVRRDESLIGHVVILRSISSTPESLRLVNNLIGPEASVLVQDGFGTWTNFTAIVEGPPPGTPEAPLDHKDADGRRWIGSGAPLRGLRWNLWVRQPLDNVTSRAEAFAARTTWVGSLVVLIGALAGWLWCRRMTRPLASLTRAAAAMAHGDLGQRVRIESRDEYGSLAVAFNSMASRVQTSKDDLEKRIAERTAQLSAANEELKAFSYSVSHDLRAPLRAISGFANILKEDHGDRLDADAKLVLDRVIDGARRMEVLIADLLELSSVSTLEMRSEPVNLTREAEEVVAELRAAWPDRVVDVVIAPGLSAKGDARLLRLVLQNLIGNAWKFTARKETARIEVGVTSDPEPVFWVKDDGAGFDMEYAERLFGVFQRMHSAKEFPGTGVGLAIVHRIVLRHGGRVWAEGVVQQGATFHFTLPGS
jgi:signal transduction histidine kinase